MAAEWGADGTAVGLAGTAGAAGPEGPDAWLEAECTDWTEVKNNQYI